MKRPLLACAAGVAAGVLLAGKSWQVLFACLVLGSTLLLGIRLKKGGVNHRAKMPGFQIGLWLFLGFLVLGFLRHEWTLAAIHYRFAPWQEKTVTIQGTLVDTPRRNASGWTLDLRVESLLEGGGTAQEDGMAMPGGCVRGSYYEPGVSLPFVYGDRVRLTGTMRLPEWQRNPGGFNTATYLSARGMTGQLILRAPPEPLPGWAGHPLVRLGLQCRQAAIDRMDSLLPPQEAAVLSGMLLGETDEMDPTLSDAFQTAGLSHLMAVSGANIAFVLLPLMWLLRRLGVNRRRAGACAIPLLLLYVLMTGFDASIVRAACMAILMLAGHLLWRKTDLASSLAGAFTVMLLANSAWLFDVGFSLSFLATSAIGLFCLPIAEALPDKIPKGAREAFAGTLSAQAGVLPVQLLQFHTLNLYALPANLVVVPLTGLLTCGGALLLLVSVISLRLAAPFGSVMGFLTGVLCRLVRWTAGLPGAVRMLAAPRVILVLLYSGWLLLLRFARPMLAREARHRLFAATALLTVFLGGLSLRPVPLLRVIVADVGQGDAILIQTPSGKNLLLDGGGSAADVSGQRVGERIVLPLLRQSGVMTPDLLISTHPHTDHLQGLEVVAHAVGAGGVVIPAGMDGYDVAGGLLETAGLQGVPVRRVRTGDVVWEEPDLRLTVLSAMIAEEESGMVDANEASLVTLLEYRTFSMLLAADAGQPAEAEMLRDGRLSRIDVLKVGHHGSNSATGEAFLDRISPDIAVISVGRNRYGHPSEAVCQRLEARGASVALTRTGGAWMLRTNGYTWQAQSFVRPIRTVFASAFAGRAGTPAGAKDGWPGSLQSRIMGLR